MNDDSKTLALVSEMKLALSNATTLEDLKRVRDGTEAVRTLAKKARLGLEIQNEAAEYTLRAERQAGEMLAALRLRGGERGPKYHDGTLKLSDLGITRNQSSRWQREASIPYQDFDAYLASMRKAGKEVSAAGLLRLFARRGRRGKRRARKPGGSAREILTEVRNHRDLLAMMLLPYCESEGETLKPAARRHVAHVLRELEGLLRALDKQV